MDLEARDTRECADRVLDTLGPAEIERILVQRMDQLRAFVRVRSGRALRALEPVSDLVQSSVREMVERATGRRFANEAALVHWIHRVALHKIISKSRRHSAGRREAARTEGLTSRIFALPLPATNSAESSPSAHVAHREDQRLLRTALSELDPVDAEIICLRRFFDLSTPKIAATLSMPESTVRWRLARGMTQLADRLR